MAAVKTYTPDDCTVTWGSSRLTGFSEDMITGSKDEEFFDTQVGAQGDVIVNVKKNDLGTVTITLQRTSPWVQKLINDAKANKMQALRVTHKTLNSSFGGSKAMIKNFPEESFGTEAGDAEFEFQVFDYSDK